MLALAGLLLIALTGGASAVWALLCFGAALVLLPIGAGFLVNTLANALGRRDGYTCFAYIAFQLRRPFEVEGWKLPPILGNAGGTPAFPGGGSAVG